MAWGPNLVRNLQPRWRGWGPNSSSKSGCQCWQGQWRPNPARSLQPRRRVLKPVVSHSRYEVKIMKKPSAIAKMKEKQALLQQSIFPNINEGWIWDVKNRKRTKGYVSIPRTMPLIGLIMDLLSGKGKPVSSVYLELWCRSNESGFVILSKPAATAFASGYSGERGVSTWKERVRRLEKLKFISSKAGPSGDLNYIQIWNPYYVIRVHHSEQTEGFSEKHYHALIERTLEIGATDLSNDHVAASQ